MICICIHPKISFTLRRNQVTATVIKKFEIFAGAFNVNLISFDHNLHGISIKTARTRKNLKECLPARYRRGNKPMHSYGRINGRTLLWNGISSLQVLRIVCSGKRDELPSTDALFLSVSESISVGVTDPVDLLHKQQIISSSYLVALIIYKHRFSPACAHRSQIRAGLTYLLRFRGIDSGSFISEIGRDSQCGLVLITDPLIPIITNWPSFYD